MGKSIELDGAEVTVIKALGFGGGEMKGKMLIERASSLGISELIDALSGLMAVGYVVSDTSEIHDSQDLESSAFQINSGYARDLKECIDPEPQDNKSKRVRRE